MLCMHHARFNLFSFSFASTCVRFIFQIVGTPYTRNAVHPSHSFDQIRVADYLLLSAIFRLPLLTCTTMDDY